MTLDEFMNRALRAFPLAQVEEDNDGQLVVYTGYELKGGVVVDMLGAPFAPSLADGIDMIIISGDQAAGSVTLDAGVGSIPPHLMPVMITAGESREEEK